MVRVMMIGVLKGINMAKDRRKRPRWQVPSWFKYRMIKQRFKAMEKEVVWQKEKEKS